MSFNDLKIYIMNTTAIAVSMADYIVDILRIGLLVLTIVYTILKIRKINGKKN
ncbi:MAG: hypothetical protein Tp139SUR460282_38 [Prokaryotic dsDNA virus sp.]|jgi:hypothetical protein|nr:MAG: hypothetical protein Tp139SUR460282_38 [Prokaryotic dsDNA virus sp.]|tara:strand:+ start:321 stop:479 length:159 start_codon:yes stop_codon:yes gene_type:complete